jgi:hypothetical protein
VLLHYLEHIYNTWNEITLGNPAIQQAVDIHVVESLQYRAPSASLIDLQHIIREIDRRVLFPTIVDGSLRQRIKQTLLRLRVIIPTIKSFHENLNYFCIGAKILQTQLFSQRIATTMYETMRSHWSSTGNAIEGIQEGEYQRALLLEGESLVQTARP